MVRRPPRSTLFPYRRSSDLAWLGGRIPRALRDALARENSRGPAHHERSEEHTSELQSLRQLVCRLLLEKKKKQTPDDINDRDRTRRAEGDAHKKRLVIAVVS